MTKKVLNFNSQNPETVFLLESLYGESTCTVWLPSQPRVTRPYHGECLTDLAQNAFQSRTGNVTDHFHPLSTGKGPPSAEEAAKCGLFNVPQS